MKNFEQALVKAREAFSSGYLKPLSAGAPDENEQTLYSIAAEFCEGLEQDAMVHELSKWFPNYGRTTAEPRCFIDDNSVIWSVFADGKSNHPQSLKIEGDNVHVLSDKDDLGPGREIEASYQLWPSLIDLSLAIKYPRILDPNQPVSLYQAVGEVMQNARSFELSWESNHNRNPKQYPMVLEADNAGAWFEQVDTHDE